MRKIILVLTLVLCLLAAFSCAPQEPPSPPEPQLKITAPADLSVILHAGGMLDGMRLLNCQEAFYHYYEQGYRTFEYDLKLSSDGRLIATHSWEYLARGYDGITYADFLALSLEGGYTPVNEDWLVEMLAAYPDVTVIVDAKMDTAEGDAAVIRRLYDLQAERGIDLTSRIVPEIFSVEMWEMLSDEVSFSRCLFSRYKEYYSIGTVVESFPPDRFIGIALPYSYLDGYYKDNIAYFQECGYRIFMFGVETDEDVLGAAAIGADTVYVDSPALLP